MTLKYFEAFAGYGTGSFAFKELKMDVKCIGYSEINKYAIQCYNQNHKNHKNWGSIAEVDPNQLPDFDIFMGGFPCQDVSLAGKRDLTKGRTMLINDVFRILELKKPKYVILENVKGLLSMNKGMFFNSIRYTLMKLGYNVKYKVLNSKNYGTPQNRERIWIIGKLGKFEPFKQIFPYPQPLKRKLKDVLESNVPIKYCLSKFQIEKIIKKNSEFDRRGNRLIDYQKDHFSSISCNISQNDILKIHSLFPRSGDPQKGGTGHLSKSDGTSYCVDTGNCQALEISPCITTELAHSTGKDWDCERFKKVTGEFRRLTPKECFRLMGFFKDQINLEGLSDTQIYRLAGNGWDLNLVTQLFKEVFK